MSDCKRYKIKSSVRGTRLNPFHPQGVVSRIAHIVHACKFTSSLPRDQLCVFDFTPGPNNTARRLQVRHSSTNDYLLNIYLERVLGE